jgi:Fe-S-cluster containining protein
VAELETEGMLAEVRGFDKLSEEDFRALNRRHFALRTPCPFLEEGSCSIYAQRPLVCREYLVTSPAERCSDPSPTVRRLPLGSFVSYAVTKLESADPTDSRLALVLALEWTEAHAGEDQTLRPATEWIEKMLEGMTGKPLPGPGAGT